MKLEWASVLRELGTESTPVTYRAALVFVIPGRPRASMTAPPEGTLFNNT
jgi:hypothetical protein